MFIYDELKNKMKYSFYVICLITWHSILQPHQNSLILHAFMDLFCSFVRVNLFSEKVT